MKTFLNIGIGVNSTAILAMMKLGELQFENPIAVFADVGAEKRETYEYLEYLKTVSPIPIHIVKSKEKDGSLYEYCKKRNILPQRYLRWCTDRWKRVPLTQFRKKMLKKDEEFKCVIGIAKDEEHRVSRWRNDIHALFPLIDMNIDRKGCIQKIKDAGWKIPVKSGCWFCPFANLDEFVQLKKNDRERYDELCQMEKLCLKKLSKAKIKGWYNDKYPLDELLARKKPISCDGQQCLYCFDGMEGGGK